MIALYIFLVILALLILLCFVRVQVFASYTDDLRLRLKVLFFELKLLPAPEKKEKKEKKKPEKKVKKPKKAEGEKKEEEKKEKKPSYLSKLKDKKGVTGLISLFTELAKLAGGTLNGILSHVVINKLDVGIALNSGDAASTALSYGKLCSVFYPAVNVITSVTVCKSYNVTLEPVFDSDRETEVYADVHAHIRVGFALWEALKAGVKLLIFRIRM